MAWLLPDSSGVVWEVTITTLGELQATVSAGGSAAAGLEVAPRGSDLIKSALRLIGALGVGETLSAEDSATGLEALNYLIDSWNTEQILVSGITRNVYALTADEDEYTIGSGGTFNTTRPIRIDRAGLMPSGYTFEYPLDVLTPQKYAAIADKTISGTPYSMHYRPDPGLGRIFMYPVQSAADSLVLYEESHLAQITNANAYLSLVPGMTRALKYNLAVELAPEYRKPIDPDVREGAIDSKAAVKLANHRPMENVVDSALRNRSARDFDIRSGDN